MESEINRDHLEYFITMDDEPLAITHFYMIFDSKGDLFANLFTKALQSKFN